jgi:phosphoglycerate dehydrogenase-like enzyme
MTRPRVIVACAEGAQPPPLERLAGAAELVVVRTEDELRAALPGVEILLLSDIHSQLLKRVGPADLRWIHTTSIGVDALLTHAIVDSQVLVSNSRGVFERPMAEWVLGVLLMFAKDMRRTLELQREARWLHRETQTIAGRRVLLIGPGAVGQATAPLLRAAGMDVTVVGRRARNDDPVLGPVHAVAELDRLLPEADAVVLALPLTPATRGMFGAERLARMREGAWLVNVGRGALIDERALIDELESGRVGGAALDVFEHEPLHTDHPFWMMDNVLVSPHMSADAVGWREAVVDGFAANLRRWLQGEPLANVVDLRDHGAPAPAPV